MNFREHFEAWHKEQYGYIGKMAHHSTALNTFYQTTACQQRWEAWQACADWHTAQSIAQRLLPDNAALRGDEAVPLESTVMQQETK